MTARDIYYPEFAHAATELSAYIDSLGIFVLSMRSGGVVSHTPADAEGFRQWLAAHGVRDISRDDGVRRVSFS